MIKYKNYLSSVYGLVEAYIVQKSKNDWSIIASFIPKGSNKVVHYLSANGFKNKKEVQSYWDNNQNYFEDNLIALNKNGRI